MNKKGFTFLEIIIVCLIVVLLFAVIHDALREARIGEECGQRAQASEAFEECVERLTDEGFQKEEKRKKVY